MDKPLVLRNLKRSLKESQQRVEQLKEEANLNTIVIGTLESTLDCLQQVADGRLNQIQQLNDQLDEMRQEYVGRLAVHAGNLAEAEDLRLERMELEAFKKELELINRPVPSTPPENKPDSLTTRLLKVQKLANEFGEMNDELNIQIEDMHKQFRLPAGEESKTD